MIGSFFDANSTLSVPVDELCELHAHYGFAGALVHADPAEGESIDQANERLAAACRGRGGLHFSWLLTPGAPADAQLAAMKAAGATAARLLPTRYAFTVDRATCGPLLAALARQRCCTFLDGEKLGWGQPAYDWDEIARVCRESPDLPLVVVRCAGLDPIALYRLWGEGANLYAETSYYVTPDGLADAARHGFADRLLLGSGLPKWEAACPLTQLRLAAIDEEAFSAIAGNTARRLLGLPLSTAPPQRGVDHSLRIIDAHGHFGRTDSLYNPVTTARQIVEILARNGISRTYVSSIRALEGETAGNAEMVEAIRPFPQQIRGYFCADTANPETLDRELVRAIDEWGMIGIKIHCACDECSLDDARYAPLLHFADERRLPVLVHGIDPPETFERVCRCYPNLRMLIAHVGGEAFEPAAPWIEMIRRTPNAHVDFCLTRCERGALQRLVETYGPQKLLFATDFCFNDQAFALGRLLGADLPRAVKQHLAFENAMLFYDPSP